MSRVFLHLGLPKSGTSYIQRLMIANRATLGEKAGLLFPGKEWKDQVAAVRDVRSLDPGPQSEGAWQRLVDEVMAWHGDALISMEWLAPAGPRQIERIAGSFGARQVEVILTARDLARTLPAAWQEFLQNEQSWTWREFLQGVSADDPRSTKPGKLFWRQQDLPVLLERWAEKVPLDRIHLITIPPSGAPRDLLWERVAGVLGVPTDAASTADLFANESLGLESAEVMRRVNELVPAAGVDRRAYNVAFKHRLAKQVLASRKSRESSVTIPPDYHPWISTTAAAHIDRVRRSGVRVVGDLAELEPRLSPAASAGKQPEDISDTELLSIALDALVEMTKPRRTQSSSTAG